MCRNALNHQFQKNSIMKIRESVTILKHFDNIKRVAVLNFLQVIIRIEQGRNFGIAAHPSRLSTIWKKVSKVSFTLVCFYDVTSLFNVIWCFHLSRIHALTKCLQTFASSDLSIHKNCLFFNNGLISTWKFVTWLVFMYRKFNNFWFSLALCCILFPW